MLELIQISRSVPSRAGDPRVLLESVSFTCPAGQVTAVVGAPGSGKHSLLEIITKVVPLERGTLLLHGRDLTKQPLTGNEMGYVSASPEHSLDCLSVMEFLISALMLRVDGLEQGACQKRVSRLVALCGLETVAGERLKKLNRLQRRKLELVAALLADPLVLICEDFTRDLDAKSGRELMALLRVVAQDVPGRVVLHVTESLSHLPAHDTVVVMIQGQVAFHGPSRAIPHYFTIKSLEDLYVRLAMRPASRWGNSWTRHRDSYYDAFKISRPSAAEHGGEDSQRIRLPQAAVEEEEAVGQLADLEPGDLGALPEGGDGADRQSPLAAMATAKWAGQVKLLVRRRWTRFWRTRREWVLQALFSLGMPALLVLMIWPNRHYLMDFQSSTGKADPNVLWPAAFTILMVALVQVLMLVLMSVRNGARELVAERSLFDRERLAGVRPSAYYVSKLLFVAPLVLLQTVWMALCVEMFVGHMPGVFGVRLVLLMLTGFAFTALCLAVSAFARSPERAHSACLSLGFFQVLLSGAMLGMPRVLGGVLHQLVTAYYGWSGIIESMQGSAAYAAISQLLRTWFAPPSLAMGALAGHLAVGLVLAIWGLRKRRLP